jgi:hypothetical protein
MVKPQMPTEFELQMETLGLTETTCVGSEPLRQWCLQNKNRCYIPEDMLKLWKISVEADVI